MEKGCGVRMRRLLAAVLALCLLPLPVQAAEAADTEKPAYVVLTFDDGPSGRFTRALLDGLSARGVHATFLLCGYRIAQSPELTEAIYAAGHEIGLHGYSHKCMENLCPAEIEREIADTLALLPAGCRPVFLRPPGGVSGASVRAAAEQAGLSILNWSVDPRDWATHDAASVERAVLKNVKDGDVILLHDMSDSSTEAALYIVDTLQKRGFCFVTASQLADLRGIELKPGKTYRRFSG